MDRLTIVNDVAPNNVKLNQWAMKVNKVIKWKKEDKFFKQLECIHVFDESLTHDLNLIQLPVHAMHTCINLCMIVYIEKCEYIYIHIYS